MKGSKGANELGRTVMEIGGQLAVSQRSQNTTVNQEQRTKTENKRRESKNAVSEMCRWKYQTGYMERSIVSRHNCRVIHVSVINECIRVRFLRERV